MHDVPTGPAQNLAAEAFPVPAPRPRHKHEELADQLRQKILKMASGARIPSVRSLIKRYQVSLQTVNSALRQLESENLVVARQGSGIYVSDLRPEKLVIFHRSRHPSYYEDSKERSLHGVIAAAGWHLSVHRHDAIDQDDIALAPEPRACAHLVSQDLANLKFDLLNQLLKQKVPIVLMDRDAGSFPFDSVMGNDHLMLSTLIKHLHGLGHRRFAFLVNEPLYYEIKQRQQLFREILDLFDLPPVVMVECNTKPGQKSSTMAYAGLKHYLQGLPGPLPFTALITSSTAGGPGALRALHEHGIEVPRQCSVVCCGIDEENALTIPSLTGSGPRFESWGQSIVGLLQQRFDGDKSPSISLKLPVELSLRESATAPPATPVVRKVLPAV